MITIGPAFTCERIRTTTSLRKEIRTESYMLGIANTRNGPAFTVDRVRMISSYMAGIAMMRIGPAFT